MRSAKRLCFNNYRQSNWFEIQINSCVWRSYSMIRRIAVTPIMERKARSLQLGHTVIEHENEDPRLPAIDRGGAVPAAPGFQAIRMERLPGHCLWRRWNFPPPQSVRFPAARAIAGLKRCMPASKSRQGFLSRAGPGPSFNSGDRTRNSFQPPLPGDRQP